MIRVFILAAIRLYRESLATMLARSGEVRVVGTAPVSADAESHMRALRPNVVLLDACTPDAHALARQLQAQFPDVALIGIGIHNTEMERLQWAEVGIIGYVTHEATPSDLLSVVQRAARGEAVFSPQMARDLVRKVAALTRERHVEPQHSLLTRREREIVALLAQDLSNKEIATRLGIEITTVKNHVHNMLEKLRVQRRSQIVEALTSSQHPGSQATGTVASRRRRES